MIGKCSIRVALLQEHKRQILEKMTTTIGQQRRLMVETSRDPRVSGSFGRGATSRFCSVDDDDGATRYIMVMGSLVDIGTESAIGTEPRRHGQESPTKAMVIIIARQIADLLSAVNLAHLIAIAREQSKHHLNSSQINRLSGKLECESKDRPRR